MLISLLIVIVAAFLFGLIAYRFTQGGPAASTFAERLRSDGAANASSTQRLVVFEIVVAAIILIQSSASWPLKIGIFVTLQVVTVGFLAGVKSFYEGR
jgi:biotin transporter BioY